LLTSLTIEIFSTMVKTFAAVFLFIHGFAHTVGFFVQWKILKLKDIPFSTKIFYGKFDVGNAGIHVVGIIWLFIAIFCVLAGYGILSASDWWKTATLLVILFSFIFCILGLPDTKMGIIANVIVIAFLY
jgi:hypothetical protein